MNRIQNIFEYLFKHYGPQSWWPADDPFECVVGAILTQNTAWKNAEFAIRNLKSHMVLNEKNLSDMPTEELVQLIKPSGYYNQKAFRLKSIVNFINQEFDGKTENMALADKDELRSKLLSINGLGPETVDTILLYALNKPVFVVDKYTYRIFHRHGLLPMDCSYEEMQEMFMDSLEEDPAVFNEYHALIVKVGKEHCGKRASCDKCPLAEDPHEFSDEII